jgi:multidrug efflux pump subunit AcrB
VSLRAWRDNLDSRKQVSMFLILAVVLIILWLGGFFVLHISSFLIHLLLIFAVISIIMNFVSGKRAV